MADEGANCMSARSSKVDFVRQEYKRYKRKKPPPDFSEVIDFDNSETFHGRVDNFKLNCNLPRSNFGLHCTEEWRTFKLKSCPGFIFIANPFLPGAQHFWTRRCIRDFPRKPNVSNLDAHMELGTLDSVWEMSRNESGHQDLMDKLRWVHLGYHFDYNVVSYKPDKYYGFPEDLGSLMQHIALAIGYPGYIPEAAIVNYYPLGSSMGGHTDHYELDLSWPLVSISFGQTAVFLIGGTTRDVKPTALYIRSGDIIIMSGESRAAFHAVPRIVKVGDGSLPPGCLQWDERLCCQSGVCACSKDSDSTDQNLKTSQETRGGSQWGNVSQRPCGSSETGISLAADHLSLCEMSINLPGTETKQATESSALHEVALVHGSTDSESSVLHHVPLVHGSSDSESSALHEVPLVHGSTDLQSSALHHVPLVHGSSDSESSVLHQVPASSDSDLVHELNIFSDCNKETVCSNCGTLGEREQGNNYCVIESLNSLTQEEWQPFEYYLSKTRINVNVRQVHKPSETVVSFDSNS